MQTTDAEIRKALHAKVLLSHHRCPSTVVIDELGLSHGKYRIDIAVLNGYLHGYEIKSSKDNLLRLPNQLTEYCKSLQKLTIVCAPNHLTEVIEIAPHWCGITEATKGARGGISFSNIRKSTLNPNVDLISLAHLLWRKEAVELLEYLGVTGKTLNNPREKLYAEIADLTSLNELVSWVKHQFMRRENWRVDLQPL